MNEPVSSSSFWEPTEKDSTWIKNLQKLGCGAFDDIFSVGGAGGGGWDHSAFKSWNHHQSVARARSSPQIRQVFTEYNEYFEPSPSTTGVEIELHDSNDMDILVKEMKKNRLEDERSLKGARNREAIAMKYQPEGVKNKPERNHRNSLGSMDYSAQSKMKKGRNRLHRYHPSTGRSSNQRNSGFGFNSCSLQQQQRQQPEEQKVDLFSIKPEDPYSKQLEYVSRLNDLTKKEMNAYIIPKEEDRYKMDSMSVLTGDTEPETLPDSSYDGSWPDNLFVRALNGATVTATATATATRREDPPQDHSDDGSWPDDPFSRALHGATATTSTRREIPLPAQPSLAPRTSLQPNLSRKRHSYQPSSCGMSESIPEMWPIQWNDQGLMIPTQSNPFRVKRLTTYDTKEEEDIDEGSWPDDPISRELHGTGADSSPRRENQVHTHLQSLQPNYQSPRVIHSPIAYGEKAYDSCQWGSITSFFNPDMWQVQLNGQGPTIPTHSPIQRTMSPEQDELCNATSCRMSTGICVDCTKCSKHCDCDCDCDMESKKGKTPIAVYSPPHPSSAISEQMICGDCSRYSKNCECYYLIPGGGPSKAHAIRQWASEGRIVPHNHQIHQMCMPAPPPTPYQMSPPHQMSPHEQMRSPRTPQQMTPHQLIRTSSLPSPHSAQSFQSTPSVSPSYLQNAGPAPSPPTPVRRCRSMTAAQFTTSNTAARARANLMMRQKNARSAPRQVGSVPRQVGSKREVVYRNFQQ